MKTIGFFGDSFCASNQPESWCNILQEKLGANRIRWFGEPGRSIWNTMFKFNKLISQNRVPDISVFCWTEPYRLYHPELILSLNTKPLEGIDPNIYNTLDNYWKYLHSTEKDDMAYEYALKHYDQNILSEVNSEIVQMWSFRPENSFKLTTGTFIDESMFEFSKGAGVKDGWGIGTVNHMTEEQNQQWADKVYGRFRI
jgi:hypothetical protein